MSDDIEKPDKKAAPKSTERLHSILSNDEVLEVRKEARAKLEKERVAAAKKELLAKETQRLREEEGLVVSNSVGDEMVSITIDLPPYAARILVNGNAYWHGHTYTMPRHVANSLRETMYRGQMHQQEIEGRSITEARNNARNTVISAKKGISNAPRAFDA